MTRDTTFAQQTAALYAEKARIEAELRAYPRPIAACDVQFNTLLEQRDAINKSLRAHKSMRADRGSKTGHCC